MSLATPDKIRRLQRKLYVKAKREPQFRFYQLYDKVYREDILAHAYALSRVNGGAPGIDGVDFEEIEAAGLEEWLRRLGSELRERRYKPAPVRRVTIPKPGGGERPLGIPTVRDRVVQTAAKILLEPIFEADFTPCAYGYRPKRSALQAVVAVHRALCEGYREVVDADLTRYFDSIPHAELLETVRRRITDRHLLRLLREWLRVPVEVGNGHGVRRLIGGKKQRRGTPQGGVISPLLANIYMHRYLTAWSQQAKAKQYAARVINYADDFVILSRGKAAQALEWTRREMTDLGLTLNEAKTQICDTRQGHFDFLGYTFGLERFRKTGHLYLAAKPSKKAVARLKGKLRDVLREGMTMSWPAIRDRLNRMLRGWSNYFGYGTRLMAYRGVDAHVLTIVQNFLQRRHKVSGRGTTRFRDSVVFGELGILRLRRVHLGPPATVEA